MTELNILTIPNGTGQQYKEIVDHLRPFISEHNIILTTTDLKPISLEQLEEFLLKMLKLVRSRKEPVIISQTKDLSSETKEKVDREVTEILKREGKL